MSDPKKLMETNRWCYYLKLDVPGRKLQTRKGDVQTYHVCIVIENQAGMWPTGGNGKAPWYWSEAFCADRNAARGLSEDDVMDIIDSSMRQGRV